MTKKEAISILSRPRNMKNTPVDILEAHEMAIMALKAMPANKDDLALIHTEGLDEEIRCTMCTNYMKSDRGCDGSCVVNKDMYKAVMDAIEKRIHPTTKNDLAVDAVSRQEVDRLARIYLKEPTDNHVAFYEDFLDLPSVTPIRPKGHWISRPHVYGVAFCSECGFELKINNTNYCPNCGADMSEVDNGNDD